MTEEWTVFLEGGQDNSDLGPTRTDIIPTA